MNQQRGNLPFVTVGIANWTSTNGGKHGDRSWPGCNGTVFKPIDAYKGEIAYDQGARIGKAAAVPAM